jgi:sigma-B regulation protein RsbU (phosphoserine phosphatase)
MQKGVAGTWRRLGRVEKAFLISVLLYFVLRIWGGSPVAQAVVALAAFFLGLKEAIWRLRNRLIAAYLFIAVVPIVLILLLVGIAGWMVIGQMAVYLVNTELTHREMSLWYPAEALATHPTTGDPQPAIRRFSMMIRNGFPNFQLLMKGSHPIQYPDNANIDAPSPDWKDAHGLILKKEGGVDHLYAWAHAEHGDEEVTAMAPVTSEFLSGLVPGLGDVAFVPLMDRPRESHVPPAKSIFDFPLRGFFGMDVHYWDNPHNRRGLVLAVDTRISAVLGTVFQKIDWAELALAIFVVVTAIFLLVELVSLVAGIQLSRSITGAVHELYEATQHVKEGDFSYRIPVKGNDQLAELGSSFNTMTENLGRLIIVAKEKERLESELEIAREVQNQLFPKDVPFTKTLELKGVCSPARVVSGDYYDFMSLSDSSLAFAIGDVAGKGISAALLMAAIQSTMRTQLGSMYGTGLHASTAQLVSNLNKQLYATTSAEKYATFYFGMYDEPSHTLTYTNAGHLAPMLLRDGNFEMLDSTGTVVGAFPFAHYKEKTVTLEHGDMLVAYTDGIVEPENEYGEMFGEDRLKDLVTKFAHTDSSEIIARTMESVIQWTGSTELQDDMTMVVARRI